MRSSRLRASASARCQEAASSSRSSPTRCSPQMLMPTGGDFATIWCMRPCTVDREHVQPFQRNRQADGRRVTKTSGGLVKSYSSESDSKRDVYKQKSRNLVENRSDMMSNNMILELDQVRGPERSARPLPSAQRTTSHLLTARSHCHICSVFRVYRATYVMRQLYRVG